MFSYHSPDRKLYSSLKITSRYLTMRDGTRIAIDVIFPQPYDFRKPLPVLLNQTRYWRRPALKKPFSWVLSPFMGFEAGMLKEMVLNGFVFVNVDARGTGASFGSRTHPWSEAEVEDGREIVDWVIQQSWSNGNVGAIGISYTGTSAEFLATRQHPAVKAYLPLFSLYDVYDDIALPGGVPLDFFVQTWGQFNELMDKNQFPLPIAIAKMILGGVAPVKGDRAALKAALEDHKHNLNVDETSRGLMYRDQGPTNKVVEGMGDFSPHTHQEKINGSGGSFMSVSGWHDGGYQHAAIKRFLTTKAPLNNLVIGPWSHGGAFHTSPGFNSKTKDRLVGMPISYFDHFLKGYDTPILTQPKVQYFTMGEESWKSAEEWPPAGLVEADLFLGHSGKLQTEVPGRAGHVELHHNSETRSGTNSRWRALIGLVRTHQYYKDRIETCRTLLKFETAPLGSDLEVTGHPMIELWVKTSEKDGTFFVYIDDVLPSGEVRYVTEGMLRAIHRDETNSPFHEDCVPQRSYLEADARPLDHSAPNRLYFDLLPTSYQFKAGHQIRISLATADKDHFADLTRPGASFGIMVGGDYPSRMVLPVMV